MNSNDFKQNFINAVLGKLSSNTKYSPEIENWLQTLPEEQRIGAANGKNFGDKAILAKQQELNIPIPQGQEQLALANEGKFNPYTHGGGIRQGGLINGYNQGYNLNYDNPTDQISTRIGQALGTIKRGADSPLGRAVIAYGASRMMGDANPLKQAATAYGTRENVKTADQLYRKQLNNMGVDTSGINGEIKADMVKTLSPLLSTGTKFTTLGAMAMYSPEAQARIAAGADPNTIVPNTLAKDFQNNVLGLNTARIENLNAKTESEKQLLPYKIKEIDAKITQGQARLNLYAQKIKNGTATDSDKAEYNRLRNENMKLAIEKKKAEVEILKQYTTNPGGNPLPVTNVPLNNTPAPQAQPKQNANGNWDF